MGKTRGVHETTPELRNRMVGMYEAGLGLREIAAAVNCSQRTVKRWLNRFDKEGTVETRDRCGRKRATTVEEDEAIVRLATQTPITAAKAVLPALGLNCSVDTIRERLHKAGIHNWSPSRKHIQRISLGDADGAAIQQAVWRPTGTQLGKKKSHKHGSKLKKCASGMKKKNSSRKIKSKELYVGDGAPSDTSKQQQEEIPRNQSFSFAQDITEQQSVSQQQQQQQSQSTELQPPHQPPESLINNQSEYNNPLSLTLPTHQIYPQHHPPVNVSQSWPLDLVQNSHHYPPSQSNPMAHDHPPPQQHLHELHTQREQEQHVQQTQVQHDAHEQLMHEQHNQQTMQHSFHHHINHHPMDQQQQLQHQIEQVQQSPLQQLPNPPAENIETRKIMRANSCSNSCSSDENSDDDTEMSKDDSRQSDSEGDSDKSKKKKKGGKAKGTLETSVEIRNRMIGMAEAGLSTLSIALAINRSERTVKRWLERWNKEGNVQTKERKGRRRITTKEQDDAIIAMATQHPLTAAKHVAPALGLNCSVDTIRERLHKAGIHSWKLGKKQGEGNAVHTVHLWQPSGNRPNKPKILSEKKKKSSVSGKKSTSLRPTAKRIARKKKIDIEVQQQKIIPPPTNIISEPNPIQYHDPGALTNYPPGPNMMQPVHITAQPSSLPPPASSQCPPGSQSMHSMGPMIQQRSDCRMVSSVSSQGNLGVTYSSCMVGNNSHMEQTDPLNYEPFIWTF